MGNISSIPKINFEDMQLAIKENDKYLIINVMETNMQQCLIEKTVSYNIEETVINELIEKKKKDINIIIYGKNSNDEKIFTKYKELRNLGFTNVYIYIGGMFMWLLLQDIYGQDLFPTTSKELDILKYKSHRVFDVKYINN